MALTFIFLFFIPHLLSSISAQSTSMESVPDLQSTMYTDVDGFPCVRLLSLSGTIGCSNPGRDKVVAPIVRFENVDDVTELSSILVSMDQFPTLFNRLSADPSFASKVGGVLVESVTDSQKKLNGFSPDQKFPLAEFAPYHNISYEWNPIGSGIMWKSYGFPVFLLTESGTKTLQEFVLKGEDKKKAYTSNVAEFDLVMQTMKSGTHDSESCLNEGTCLPLGGYSVWSALPPINNSSSKPSKPIILTVASMDSASFFRDRSLGADSPISGLIALLAAADALSHLDGIGDLSKQVRTMEFSVFGLFVTDMFLDSISDRKWLDFRRGSNLCVCTKIGGEVSQKRGKRHLRYVYTGKIRGERIMGIPYQLFHL